MANKLVYHKFADDIMTDISEVYVDAEDLCVYGDIGIRKVLLKEFDDKLGLGNPQTWLYKFVQLMEEPYV